MLAMKRISLRVCASLLLTFTLIGCGESAKAVKTLRVGFVPAEDAQQVMQKAQPLGGILHKEFKMEIQPFGATHYTRNVEGLRGNKLHVAFLAAASFGFAKNTAQ